MMMMMMMHARNEALLHFKPLYSVIVKHSCDFRCCYPWSTWTSRSSWSCRISCWWLSEWHIITQQSRTTLRVIFRDELHCHSEELIVILHIAIWIQTSGIIADLHTTQTAADETRNRVRGKNRGVSKLLTLNSRQVSFRDVDSLVFSIPKTIIKA